MHLQYDLFDSNDNESSDGNEITLKIDGKPDHQPRPRFFLNQGKVKVFDPAKKQKQRDKLIILRQLHQKRWIIDAEARISVSISFQYKKKKKLKEGALKQEFRGKKPDIDNLIKYYLDVMNDLVYLDDRFVCSIRAEKVYSSEDKTIIKVRKHAEF